MFEYYLYVLNQVKCMYVCRHGMIHMHVCVYVYIYRHTCAYQSVYIHVYIKYVRNAHDQFYNFILQLT